MNSTCSVYSLFYFFILLVDVQKPRDSAGVAGGGRGRGQARESTGHGKGMSKGDRGGKCCCLIFQQDGREARESQRPPGWRLLSHEVIIINVITQKYEFL